MLSRFITPHLLFLFLSVCPLFSYADIKGVYEGWRWVRFGSESGLPSERILQILETPRGEIWVRTSRGLARFDEFRWNEARIAGISYGDQSAYSVGSDSLGILVSHEGKLYHLDQDSVRILDIRVHNRSLPVRQAYWSPYGRVLQGDSSLFIESGNEWKALPSPYDKPMGPEAQPRYYNNSLISTRNALWLKQGGSFYRFSGSGWVPKLTSPSGYLKLEYFQENDAGYGVAVMATSMDGMNVFFWGPGGKPRPFPREAGDLVLSIDVSPTGQTLMLLSSGKLRLHDRGKIQTLPPFPSPVNHPLCVCFRPNGDLWVGTERGLFLCRLNSGRWDTWELGQTARANIVNSMIQARDGSFWIGTRDGVFVRSPEGKMRAIRTIGAQELGRVTALAEDREGNIWIGSGVSFEGAYRWDGKSWRHFGSADGLTARLIHKIVVTRSGQLWFLGIAPGALTQDLSHEPGAFRYSEGAFHRTGTPEGLRDGRVYALVEDRDSALWFGTLTGVSRLSHGTWRYWDAGKELAGFQVFTLAVDSSNRVWLGQKWGGAGCIDSTGIVRYYKVEDGLVSNRVWDLFVDTEGRVWIATAEGVGCFDGKTWMSFDVHTGLANSEVWPVLVKNHRMYAGTKGSGVSVLNLDQLNSTPPMVNLESPVVDDKRVTLSWSVNAYWADIPPNQIDTRYRLAGQAWSMWSSAHSVVYNRLGTGAYRFEVELRPASQPGVTRSGSVSFTILPPLYLRPAVAIPIVLLGLLALTLAAAMWERKRRYDRSVRESEARFRAQYRSNPIPTFTWKRTDDSFILTDVNDAGLALGRGRLASWVGKPLHELLQDHPQSIARLERCYAEQSVIHEEIEFSFVPETGNRDFIVTYSYVYPDMVLTHIDDVTERKRAERRIRESREQLRALAARLESVREEERTQLSREIHDELGQLMTGLKMDLAWIRKRVLEYGGQAADAMMRRVQQMNGLLDDSIQTVRKIAGQLRPALLDQLGLMAAMEWQAKEWQSRTGIICQIDMLIDEPRFSHEQATDLFRIFQELLTNVARHAEATKVAVVLDEVGSEMCLEVRDNGRGIREEEINRPVSLGILGMEERTARFGGRIIFTGEAGKGTTVRVTIPIEQVTP
jgi:signal transduction histidine kinase/sugar lactone lactonase YvrE